MKGLRCRYMRKKYLKPLAIASVIAAQIALGLAYRGGQVLNVKADSASTYPGMGTSGTLFFINGNGHFNDADLAIYCFNSETDNAWSDRVNYRISGDTLRVMLPYQNGNSKTWSKYIVCRYDKNKNPSADGWGGVYAQSPDMQFSDMRQYGQNTITISGHDDAHNSITINEVYGITTYYGIKSEQHIYLDLTDCPGWENDGAKFALYFAAPNVNNESGWSRIYEDGVYRNSFLWKVEGQSNPYLYEGIVPSMYTNDQQSNIWNLVIAVRYSPDATAPGWDNKWNQTVDLKFDSSNAATGNTSNIIRVTGWGSDGNPDPAQILDPQYKIAKDTRLGFFGTYFLNTVTCSSTGASDATTAAQWASVKTAYTHLSRELQGDVWKAAANEDGTLVEQAMARYDYIVFYKQYNHEDFINRADPDSGADHTSMPLLVEKNNSIFDTRNIILIIAIIM